MIPSWIEIALVITAYLTGRVHQLVRDAKSAMEKK